MPFQSEAQRRYMWKNHPAIARRWAKKYGSKTEDDKKSSKGGRATQ